jgi:MFS family permease
VKEGPTTARFGARLVASLAASAVLNPINSTLIAVALVPIGQTFGAGPAATAWLVSALYLSTAVGQPVVGLFVDRYGARRVLLIGAATVLAAGVAGMFALSLGWLIGVRVVLGVGTCAGFPAAMAVLRHRGEATGQGVPSRVLSVLSMSSQTIMVIGPTLGGVLIGLFGWPAIFAVNVPLALVSIVLALCWVPKDAPKEPAGAHLDVRGVVLFSLALLALLVFVMRPSLPRLPALAAALVLAGVLGRVELRHESPFLDLRMLAANKAILRTYLRQALAFVIIYSVVFGYVQWLESARGLAGSTAGLMLVPMSAVAVAAAAFSGRGGAVRARLGVTALTLTAGSASLLLIGAGSATVLLLAVVALFGLGQGLTSVANQTTLYREAPAEQVGTASGLFRSAQYLGAVAASTIIAHCFGSHATTDGLHLLALTLLLVSVVLVGVTVLDRALGRADRNPASTAVGVRDPQRARA